MQERSLIPVSAHHGLHRDAHSNAIINTDDAAYQNVLRQRENRIKNREEIDDMKCKIEALIKRCTRLESEVNILKNR
jgi:hypothetical protein